MRSLRRLRNAVTRGQEPERRCGSASTAGRAGLWGGSWAAGLAALRLLPARDTLRSWLSDYWRATGASWPRSLVAHDPLLSVQRHVGTAEATAAHGTTLGLPGQALSRASATPPCRFSWPGRLNISAGATYIRVMKTANDAKRARSTGPTARFPSRVPAAARWRGRLRGSGARMAIRRVRAAASGQRRRGKATAASADAWPSVSGAFSRPLESATPARQSYSRHDAPRGAQVGAAPCS